MSAALFAALFAGVLLVAGWAEYMSAEQRARVHEAHQAAAAEQRARVHEARQAAAAEQRAAEQRWSHHDTCLPLRSSGACVGLSATERARRLVPDGVPLAWSEIEARGRRERYGARSDTSGNAGAAPLRRTGVAPGGSTGGEVPA